MRTACFSAIAVAALCSGCASRSIPPDPGPPAQPRASWTLTAGDFGNGGRVLCRSDATDPCVIQLKTGEKPLFASVSIYLYAAGAKTTYSGVFFSSFVGDLGKESRVSYEITPGQQPTLISHIGRVVDAPGSYEFRLSLLAAVPNEPEPHKFEYAVPVRLSRGSAEATKTVADAAPAR
jgi:hypothetical protein